MTTTGSQFQVRTRGEVLAQQHQPQQQQQQHQQQHQQHVLRNRHWAGYAASEASSTLSDEMTLPATPSSPLPPASTAAAAAHHVVLQPHDWSYARSDSVTTSGLGSEVSDTDTRLDDTLSLCSGSARFGWQSEETDSLPADDGVFTEASAATTRSSSPSLPLPPPPAPSQVPLRSRPRPSSLLGITPAIRDVNDWKPRAVSDDSFCRYTPPPLHFISFLHRQMRQMLSFPTLHVRPWKSFNRTRVMRSMNTNIVNGV